MRKAMLLGLALLGAITADASAQPVGSGPAAVQPVYWDGGYCGPGCREHQWRRHERWEARRYYWHHRHREEQRYGYYGYPRY